MPIDLTTEMMQRFVGGQFEVQNEAERYIYRGEIESVRVDGVGDDATLVIRFKWMAKGVNFPPIPTGWINETNLDYQASMLIYTVSDIGNDRICIRSHIVNEQGVFFPPDGSRLDPAKVEGLELSPA